MRVWIAYTTLMVMMVTNACGGEDCCKVVADAAPDASDGYVEVVRMPVTPNRDIDVLWVIDDSSGMLDHQTDLKNNFPNFINVLNTLEGGLPNLHLGVVTTDLGTKGAEDAAAGPPIGNGPGSCSGNGKAGNLQTQGTTLVQGNFISDVKNTDGTRTMNYTGSLSSAFSAIASVGASGCGFEQPIEAAKRALNNNPANAGFLRPTANLAVLFVADEDDCSFAHSTLLGSDTSTLGPLQSFRCTRFGITCDTAGTTTDEMNTVGTKAGCHSNDASEYLTHLPDYVAFFTGLEAAGDQGIYVGAIAGDPVPVAVELRAPPGGGTPIPALAHSCAYNAGSSAYAADPGVRLQQLTNAFPHHDYTTICDQDLSGQITTLAVGIRHLIGDACVTVALPSPPDCKATETSGGVTKPLDACGAGTLPCWHFVSEPQCVTGDHLKLEVQRATAPAPDTVDTVSCRL